MRCTSARGLLLRQIDGEPIGWRQGAVERHVASCRECQAFADQMLRMPARLAACLPVPPPADDWPVIRDALQAGQSTPSTMTERLRRAWVFRPGPVAMAATFLLVLICGATAATLLHAEQDHWRWRHRADCTAVTEAIGDFPAGSPGHGLAEMLDRHLGVEPPGRTR